MIAILKKMRFSEVPYKPLTDEQQIAKLEAFAIQLMPLETEIAASNEGSIDIHSANQWAISSFNPSLTEKINQLLNSKAEDAA